MGQVLAILVQGLSLGLVLFLLASGWSLTMGLMRVINMAHGALYMVAAYFGVWVVKETHNWILGVAAGAVLAGLIGLLLEMGFLRRLYKQENAQVLLTIGFIYVFANAVQWIWGTYPLSAPVPQVLSGSVEIGGVQVPVFRLFIIGFGLLMALLLWLFQDKTKVGARVRAGMDNRVIASALGINLKRLFSLIFALGSLVAGLAALIGGSLMGVSLSMGWDALLYSLIVVVIGGAGSIQGALLGGILIGLLNAFGAAYFPAVASFIIYVALIVILVFRPQGLLGRKIEADPAAASLEKASESRGGPAWLQGKPNAALSSSGWQARARRWIPYLLGLAVIVGIPPFVGASTQTIFTKVLIFALFAMSLDVLMGYTGLISFGHAVFFGMAGYCVGIITVHYGVTSFWIVLPLTILITALLAVVVGYLSLRVSGVYFLLVTMAFGQLFAAIATKWYSFTGGTNGLYGIMRPNLGFSFTWTQLNFYYFVCIFFVVCYFLLNRIVRSSFGKSLIGVRENESRMKALGYNTWGLKYLAVIVAAVFAGVAGMLFAYFYGIMVPSYFALETSALPMLMVIMGGAATLWGPALGAAVIVLVQYYTSLYVPDRWPLILGVIFVLCVVALKGGFAQYLSALWGRAWQGRNSPADVSEPGKSGAVQGEVDS